MTGDFGTFMAWADEIRKLGVRANADTPEHAAEAIALGAEGIGLCRTEHMFLGSDRVPLVRDMILAEDEDDPRRGARKAASDAARGLRGHLQGDGRQAGDGPPDRPAAARVPAAAERAAGRSHARCECKNPNDPSCTEKEKLLGKVARYARAEPDARSARLPAFDLLPRHREHAGCAPSSARLAK